MIQFQNPIRRINCFQEMLGLSNCIHFVLSNNILESLFFLLYKRQIVIYVVWAEAFKVNDGNGNGSCSSRHKAFYSVLTRIIFLNIKRSQTVLNQEEKSSKHDPNATQTFLCCRICQVEITYLKEIVCAYLEIADC